MKAAVEVDRTEVEPKKKKKGGTLMNETTQRYRQLYAVRNVEYIKRLRHTCHAKVSGGSLSLSLYLLESEMINAARRSLLIDLRGAMAKLNE